MDQRSELSNFLKEDVELFNEKPTGKVRRTAERSEQLQTKKVTCKEVNSKKIIYDEQKITVSFGQ